jgi:ABC-type transporter Mla MlaB component
MSTAELPTEELELVGQLTIRRTPEIAQQIAAVLAGSNLTLSLPYDCDVDVSFIQLLAAAQKSAAASGRAIRLSQAPAGAFHDALSRGGFLETGLAALWNEKEGAA